MPKLRIGSRGSQLALWQTNHVSALLRARGHEVEIEIIHTTGDKITDVALAMVGTKGMFTKEIEEALAAGRVDLAVHSLKDLPTELPPGFEIAAITERQDPRDAFCSRLYLKVEDLPQGARVGTSSLRRQAQLKAIRPDLDIHPLRGNVDTRLRKLERGEYDAIILASAGLKRLGKTELIKQIIPAEIMCPAAGQGALGIEIREGDGATRQQLAFLNDAAARAATTCERALLN
ncbi:MAG: hydroxymethylbilane synthase, partial [Candidatus Sulfotelmatobacter sp.]